MLRLFNNIRVTSPIKKIMDLSARNKFTDIYFLSTLTILLVISFQIHWTLSFQSIELRLSLSDFILPVLLLKFALLSLKKGFIPTLKILRWPLWFVIFTMWFGISVLIGCNELGHCSTWGFVNKFLGWFILIFYFYLGNLVEKNDPDWINKILKTLFISSGMVSIFSILLYISFRPQYSLPFGVNDNGRFIGFLGNPNAYGLFAVFAVLLQIPFLMQGKLFRPLTHWFIMLPTLATIHLSGSRTAMIGLVVGIINFIIFNALNRKRIFIVLFLALILIGFIDFQTLDNYLFTRISEFYILDHAIEERLQSMYQALNWWLKKPLTGIGLDSFLVKQQQQGSLPIMTLHNTPLWLLTETGLIGLILYAGFLFKGRQEVYRRTKESDSNPLAQGMLMIFPAFMVASLTTEIFYQRYLWFFLGLVLAKQKIGPEAIPQEKEIWWKKIRLLLPVDK